MKSSRRKSPKNSLQRTKKEYIRLSEKFLSFHMMIIDEQQFMFYIILLN